MKVKTSYTGCSYITAGKIYDAFNFEIIDNNLWADITDDKSQRIPILIKHKHYKCAHLDGIGTWEIVDKQPETDIAAELAAALNSMIEWQQDMRYTSQELENACATLAKYKSIKQ